MAAKRDAREVFREIFRKAVDRGELPILTSASTAPEMVENLSPVRGWASGGESTLSELRNQLQGQSEVVTDVVSLNGITEDDLVNRYVTRIGLIDNSFDGSSLPDRVGLLLVPAPNMSLSGCVPSNPMGAPIYSDKPGIPLLGGIRLGISQTQEAVIPTTLVVAIASASGSLTPLTFRITIKEDRSRTEFILPCVSASGTRAQIRAVNDAYVLIGWSWTYGFKMTTPAWKSEKCLPDNMIISASGINARQI